MITTRVLDSHIAHTETGTGGLPVVFLHGSPTSSHLWRHVMPHVAGRNRSLAPDLIGMGASGKPDIAYRFADHADYLTAWFDAVGLEQMVLVGTDWGGALAMDYATRHPGRVHAVAVMETFLRPQRYDELPEQVVEHSRMLRTPGVREKLLLEDNFAIEGALPNPFSIHGGLSKEDHDVYRAPFLDPAARRPLLQWPQEIPFDGEPADVTERIEAYGRWLAESPDVPKLLMAATDGVGIGGPEMIEWARGHAIALEVTDIGPAGHQAPEDQPDNIGRAVAGWLAQHNLTDELVAQTTA